VTDEPAADLPAGDDPDAAALQIVCFQIGDQRYGLDIMRVKEVAFAAPVIAVPGAPAFVAGIVEVHGVYVPLVDLRRRFGVASGAAGRLLLVALDGLIIALAVDRVIDTRPVDPAAVAAPPPLAGTGHVAGVLDTGGQVILLLDPDAILDPAERRQLRALGDAA
jgi:purine-binding chemotaxis protein CheW